jgi:hypothetical protein
MVLPRRGTTGGEGGWVLELTLLGTKWLCTLGEQDPQGRLG